MSKKIYVVGASSLLIGTTLLALERPAVALCFLIAGVIALFVGKAP